MAMPNADLRPRRLLPGDWPDLNFPRRIKQTPAPWELSAQRAQQRFAADPNAPLFRTFDGTTRPSDDVSTPAANQTVHQLLLQKGLIRIGQVSLAG